MTAAPERRSLLLVEDNPADAELVIEMLDTSPHPAEYEILHVQRLADAEDLLHSKQVDVVLLDLRLPDASGLDCVKAILSIIPELPIVVLTGMDDENLALACIDAGAQDYLNKEEMKPLLLRRAIGYAITRLREAQLRDLRALLEGYKSLSSDGTATAVTAIMAGLGPIRDRSSDTFRTMAKQYLRLLMEYLEQLGYKKEKPRDFMAGLATHLGDLGAGPRDLIDLHIAALESVVQVESVERARAFVIEGRLLALEMMGLLVDYYRVGSRRQFVAGEGR
ncbi:MAG: response regulator [Xanthobacteraceae bacterium]